MFEASPVAKGAARVRSWIKSGGLTNAAIAAQSGVDEKIIRLLRMDKGNPTVGTLTKIEAVVPPDWMPTSAAKRPPRRKAA